MMLINIEEALLKGRRKILAKSKNYIKRRNFQADGFGFGFGEGRVT